MTLLAACTIQAVHGRVLHPLVLFSVKDVPTYRLFVGDFQSDLANQGLAYAEIVCAPRRVGTPLAKQDATRLGQSSVIVTVGAENLARAIALRLHVPILATYVTHHAYQKLIQHAPARSEVTALYLDQPVTRFLSLARALIPNLHAISTVLSRNEKWRKLSIVQTTKKLGYAAHIIVVPNRLHAVFSAFRFVLPGTDVLIEFPDDQVYNAVTLPTILLRTVHYGVPIIGYAPAYVHAGALAAVYSSPSEFAEQALNTVTRIRESHATLPRPAYPVQFKVLINPSIANTLGITLPSTHEILKRMHAPIPPARSYPRS